MQRKTAFLITLLLAVLPMLPAFAAAATA